MHHLLRRTSLLAAASALAVVGSVSPVQAAPDDKAAGWVSRQLTDGLIYNEEYGFNDYGLSVDVGIALEELDKDRAMRRVRTAMAGHVDSYTTGADFGSPGDIYAGATAKLARFVQLSGGDSASFGGVDLIARLNQTVLSGGATDGRVADVGASDYANLIGQTFALAALDEVGADRTGAVRSFLLQQQCPAGFFRLNFAGKGAANQACAGAPAAKRKPDTDATALAVIALTDLERKPRSVRVSIRKAVRWLKRRQADNGGFGGGPTTGAANSNSTGLAAWALGEAGACAPAKSAARWVRKRQVSGVKRGPLRTHNGAIAYNSAALKAARRNGITVKTQDQWRRASAQAALGLDYLSGCR